MHSTETVDACWLLSLAAISLSLFFCWIRKAPIAPEGKARPAALTFGSLFLAANGIVFVGAATNSTAGIAVMLAGSILTGVFSAALSILWGMRFQVHRPKSLPLLIALSYAMGYAEALIVASLPLQARLEMSLVFILCSCSILCLDSPKIRRGAEPSEKSSDIGEGRKKKYPQVPAGSKAQAKASALLTHEEGASTKPERPVLKIISPRDYAVIFFCFMSVGIANAFYQPSEQVESTTMAAIMAIASLVALAITFLLTNQKDQVSFSTLTRFVAPTLAISLFAACYLPPTFSAFAYVAIFASMLVVGIFIWVQGVLYGEMLPGGVSQTLGLPLCVHYIGSAAGTLLMAVTANERVPMMAFLMVSLLCSIVILRHNDAEGQALLVKAEPLDIQSEAFRTIQRRFELSEREGEIFSLFASGRSSSYICETCFISRNTVDTHLRHIYEKTGVHGKQALIDLLEAEKLRLLEERDGVDAATDNADAIKAN